MRKMSEKIYVTQPFLPPLEDFIPYLKDIWDSKWVTNNGKYHQSLEKELALFLGVKYISLFTNGTLALIASLKALEISGEVITTPFSFIATAHALRWNGIKPVFVDIEPGYCTIDVEKIEATITPKTTAIMPVHVYGNPCDYEKIQGIADRYGLKVIYDAAHAFGVKKNNESILNYGDLSVLSFHATKSYHTFEGGAVVCHTAEMKQRIDFLKNFGIVDELTVVGTGINAKMNEFQAALGLLQIKYYDQVIQDLAKKDEMYRNLLKNINGVEILPLPSDVKGNFGFFPIFIDAEKYGMDRDSLYENLKSNNIFARRYFYPLICKHPIYRDLPSSRSTNLQVAERKAQQVLCLPIYHGLKKETIGKICTLIHDGGI